MNKLLLIIVILLLLAGCSTVVNKASKKVDDTNTQEGINETSNQDKDNTEKSTAKESKPKYKKITPAEAKEMMVEGNIILDVRTQGEYSEGHIVDSLLLPVDQIVEGKLDLLTDKEQVILIYCRSGNRSKVASKALIKSGYKNVYDFGGINKWPYETVK